VTSKFPKYCIPKELLERPKDILVLGLGKHEMIIQISDWPTKGGQSNVDIETINHHAGGSGMNVAATVARLGGHSALIASLGAGEYGQTVYDEMVKSNVKTKYVKRVDGTAGSLLVILTRSDGDWTVMQSNDQNLNLSLSQLPQINAMKDFKILHIDGYSYIEQNQRPIIDEAISRARTANCLISIDTSVPVTELHSKYVLSLFSKCDIVFLNKLEAVNLTKTKSDHDLTKSLQNLDIPLIILKLGDTGSTVISNLYLGSVPAFEVPIVDTIGAGDNYAGAMLLGLCRDYPLHQASLWGAAAGSLACLGHGSLSHRYTLTDIKASIRPQNTNLHQ
jgi:sugar/nucleoside kinase (ribokinase family)